MQMNVRLLNKAQEKVPNVPILINMISRRVRQLNRGIRPLVKPDQACWEPIDLALREVGEDKMTSEINFSGVKEEILPTGS